MVAWLEGMDQGNEVSFAEAESLVGLHEWLCSFVRDGEVHSFYLRKWMRPLQFRPGQRGPLSEAAAGDLNWLLRQMAAARYLPLVEDPHYHYPRDARGGEGTPLVACDASGKWGWGVRVGGFVLFGEWAPATLAALRRCQAQGDLEEEEGGSLSISPAELIGAAFMLEAVGTMRLGLTHPRFVGRCDNDSACCAVNNRRTRSYPMHAALRCVVEREGHWGLRMRLQHIPTKENKVADLLSRGKIGEAMALVAAEVGSGVGWVAI